MGQRIYLCLPHQLQIGLFIADSFKPCIQAHTVAVSPAKVTAVLICVGIEVQMVFSRSVVMAEGAACLDLRSPQRSGVENKPTPSGRFHDRDLIILSDGQTGSPPLSGGTLLRENNRFDRPHLQRRIAHAFCHDDLSCRTDIGKVIHGLHVVYEDGVIAPCETLYQL